MQGLITPQNCNVYYRSTCNVCNGPKFVEVEERTGLGGGFDERGVVEYKDRVPSDDEYDDFGRLKKKKGASGKMLSKPQETIAVEDDEEEDEEDDEEEDDDEDVSKYDLWGNDDDEEKVTVEKKEVSKVEKPTEKPKEKSRSRSREKKKSSRRSRSRYFMNFNLFVNFHAQL